MAYKIQANIVTFMDGEVVRFDLLKHLQQK